jgi:predicted transcriptional regulator
MKTRKETKPMFTTTISLEPDTHKKLRHLALDEDKTLRQLIREAIEEFLARREKKGARK